MKSTRELFSNIRHMPSPIGLEDEAYKDIDFPSYIKNIMEMHDVKPKDLIIKLNMEKSYLYQMLKAKRAPSRNFLINFSFLLKLNLSETQRLLKIAGRQPLYPRCRKDAAVIYAITHKMSYEDYEIFINALEREND